MPLSDFHTGATRQLNPADSSIMVRQQKVKNTKLKLDTAKKNLSDAEARLRLMYNDMMMRLPRLNDMASILANKIATVQKNIERYTRLVEKASQDVPDVKLAAEENMNIEKTKLESLQEQAREVQKGIETLKINKNDAELDISYKRADVEEATSAYLDAIYAEEEPFSGGKSRKRKSRRVRTTKKMKERKSKKRNNRNNISNRRKTIRKDK